jgi:hypothetical protein
MSSQGSQVRITEGETSRIEDAEAWKPYMSFSSLWICIAGFWDVTNKDIQLDE